jgi:hypothetical protein
MMLTILYTINHFLQAKREVFLILTRGEGYSIMCKSKMRGREAVGPFSGVQRGGGRWKPLTGRSEVVSELRRRKQVAVGG